MCACDQGPHELWDGANPHDRRQPSHGACDTIVTAAHSSTTSAHVAAWRQHGVTQHGASSAGATGLPDDQRAVAGCTQMKSHMRCRHVPRVPPSTPSRHHLPLPQQPAVPARRSPAPTSTCPSQQQQHTHTHTRGDLISGWLATRCAAAWSLHRTSTPRLRQTRKPPNEVNARWLQMHAQGRVAHDLSSVGAANRHLDARLVSVCPG